MRRCAREQGDREESAPTRHLSPVHVRVSSISKASPIQEKGNECFHDELTAFLLVLFSRFVIFVSIRGFFCFNPRQKSLRPG
jgi:hypothetical protein